MGVISGTFSKEEMSNSDKRKILESFVENDSTLSLLLDFISSKHLHQPNVAAMDMNSNNSEQYLYNGQSLAS